MTGKNDEYLKRQTYMLSSIGLFYIIIIGLFAIPLLAAFVVVLIQGLVDLKYAIIYGGIAISVLAAFLLVRYLLKFYRRIRTDGIQTSRAVRKKMTRGEPVQISVFKGLLTFTYGGRHYGAGPLPPSIEGPAPAGFLPEPTQPPDVVTQLRELSALKNDGIVSENEFQQIKARLIQEHSNAARSSDGCRLP